MRITLIKPRRKSLLALYIDDEYALDIDKTTFLESRFGQGSSITDEELLTLIALSKENRAKQKALYLLSRRDYFSKDLEEKISKDSDKQTANLVCRRMRELGYVDDDALAKRYAGDMASRKGYSRKKIEFELKRKGINEYLIEDILEEVVSDPVETIKAVIHKKKYANNLENDKIHRRAVAALMRLGYDYSDIKQAIDEITEQSGEF